MKNSTCIDSASHKKGLIPKGTVPKSKERLFNYKKFAMALSYPEGEFFAFFFDYKLKKEELILEYDRLFRSNEIWLYSSEHKAENEFQRAQDLADISGFYRAFGLETDKDRPDSLPCELEFMHYLVFKEINAPSEEKSSICRDAQKKFFFAHLYPAVKKISQRIPVQTKNNFYVEIAKELLKFLEAEEHILTDKR